MYVSVLSQFSGWLRTVCQDLLTSHFFAVMQLATVFIGDCLALSLQSPRRSAVTVMEDSNDSDNRDNSVCAGISRTQ
ncbi:unnamed protein product [Peronospora belbahrii]|uniref:Uncharacterized protein n=1 Tax=Peronospora belbahrii TaxID=622444 RepID=A0ABN8CUG8_9STRA|nr:unnamed protein product [Peronospora belbahrii]